jgi:hypothetical protein
MVLVSSAAVAVFSLLVLQIYANPDCTGPRTLSHTCAVLLSGIRQVLEIPLDQLTIQLAQVSLAIRRSFTSFLFSHAMAFVSLWHTSNQSTREFYTCDKAFWWHFLCCHCLLLPHQSMSILVVCHQMLHHFLLFLSSRFSSMITFEFVAVALSPSEVVVDGPLRSKSTLVDSNWAFFWLGVVQ